MKAKETKYEFVCPTFRALFLAKMAMYPFHYENLNLRNLYSFDSNLKSCTTKTDSISWVTEAEKRLKSRILSTSKNSRFDETSTASLSILKFNSTLRGRDEQEIRLFWSIYCIISLPVKLTEDNQSV